jgi:hypothetical protein
MKSPSAHARIADLSHLFSVMEIRAALKRQIRVIPVLVDGALMPRSMDLPDDLKTLVRRNALQIRDTSFRRRLPTARGCDN